METEKTTNFVTALRGCSASLAGQRGTVTGTHIELGRLSAVFVKLDGPHDAHGFYIASGPMLFVTLGRQCTVGEVSGVPAHWKGDRDRLTDTYEVTGWRVIDRDEFDRIHDLDEVRRDLGWSE